MPGKINTPGRPKCHYVYKDKIHFYFYTNTSTFQLHAPKIKPTTVKCENCVHYQCMHAAVQSPDCLCSYSIIT